MIKKFSQKGTSKINMNPHPRAVVFSNGCIGALAGIAWFIWRDLQDFTVISISLSIFRYQT